MLENFKIFRKIWDIWSNVLLFWLLVFVAIFLTEYLVLSFYMLEMIEFSGFPLDNFHPCMDI